MEMGAYVVEMLWLVCLFWLSCRSGCWGWLSVAGEFCWGYCLENAFRCVYWVFRFSSVLVESTISEVRNSRKLSIEPPISEDFGLVGCAGAIYLL